MAREEELGPSFVNPIETCILLAEQGQFYNALFTWFGLPEEQRVEVLRNTLTLASQRQSELSWAKEDPDCTPVEKFVLTYFSTLSSPVTQKIIVPTGNIQITERDVAEIEDSSGERAYRRFDEFVNENGISLGADSDTSDFPSPSWTFHRFSTEEMKNLLLHLSPHITPESPLFTYSAIVHPFKHIDLLTDSRLSPYVEEILLPEFVRSQLEPPILANLLSQNVFPSPECFEEIFRRIPDQCDPDITYTVLDSAGGEQQLPASAYYFTLLRRINQTDNQNVAKNPKEAKEIKQRIVSYLLNDEFIKRVLPYLKTDQVYGDELVPPGLGYLSYMTDAEATGNAAREIKRKRFSEILKTAISFLEGKGDTETIQKLTEREVGGIKFADFLS